MSDWVKKGEINYREDVRWGIADAGKTFIELLRGNNKGKMVVGIKKP